MDDKWYFIWWSKSKWGFNFYKGEYDYYTIENLENLIIYVKETGKTWKDIFRSTGPIDDFIGHEKEQYNYMKDYR